METANFTGDGNQKAVEQMVCGSAGLAAGKNGQLTFLSVLNIILSITAFLGNVLILAALRKESSLHPPSKLLLRSLVITDLCVGLISEPLYVAFLLSVVNEHWNICRYLILVRLETDSIFGGVSLLTLTAISVDRLLALLLGLRYRQVVTLKRTYVIVITFWAAYLVFAIMNFWHFLINVFFNIIVLTLCIIITIFCYTRIFLRLRHHQNQVNVQGLQQPNQTNPLNIARYRKAVFSALWLQFAFVVCYFPQGIALMTTFLTYPRLSSSGFLTSQYTSTIVFFNSTLNPILYCWKIDEVRQAVKDTIRQVVCCSST